MNAPTHNRVTAIVLATIALIGMLCPTSAQEIQLATDAPKPLTPQESRDLFRLPEGFHAELVAAEPHLADPVAMAFDAQGRILVCEIHGYNLEGYYDILELNKSGELDTVVRRIMATDEAIRRAEGEQYGTVKLLEDTDGDGLVDRSSVLADRLPPCYGVVPAHDGVIVFCAPEIIFLADRDGDGKAEVRQTLFRGFGVGELWTRISNPRWLVDNWIHGVNGGGSAGTITGPNMPGELELGSVCFRIRSDGAAIEPSGGRAHGFGQAVGQFGDRFLCTNQQHALYVAPLPYRYLVRNPYHAAPNLTLNICDYGHPARVYPTSRPDPWRTARAGDPEWVKFYGEKEATANGYFTAACGPTIYQSTEFPGEFHGNHFSVDAAQNLIHRGLLLPDGAGYTVQRPKDFQQQEFLTSTEQWFRPVNLLTGPDGALYVVDMYRGIIEDYSAIPRYLQQLYIESLIAGAQRGRIWRIVADGAPKPEPFDLSQASPSELVEQLASGNFCRRMTAQRLLVERGDTSQTEVLQTLAENGPSGQARMHALYTLDGLGVLRPEVVQIALGDNHWAVRMHGLRLAEQWLDESTQLTEDLVAMVDDEHPRVRLQVALTLGQSKDARAIDALSRMAERHAADRWMSDAILSSAAESADQLLAAILGRETASDETAAMAHALASVVGARHDNEELGRLLSSLGEHHTPGAAALRIASLNGLVEGLQRGDRSPLTSASGIGGLRRMLLGEHEETRQLALRVGALVEIQQAPEMKAAFAEARETALDEGKTLQRRTAAMALLTGAPLEELADACSQLLDARQPLDLQLAAVKALASVDDPRAGPLLLENFKSYTPKLRAAAINAVFGRRNRLPALLDAIERETVCVSSLDAIRRGQLLSDSDAEVVRRAEALLAGSSGRADRKDVLRRYRAALSQPRSVEKGKAVFEEQCAKCHKLEGEGFEVGPDLVSSRNRTDETLVSDVIDPSNQIAVGYNNYTVLTEDGRIFTGVLAAETATSVILRKEEAAEETILRRDVDEMEASPLSMMPEDLEKEVSPKEVADLIAFLRKSLGPVEPALMLFEDELTLVEALGEGGGTVRLDTSDAFSGDASLVVTPLQRHSPRISGWEFRIRETPAEDEYRYLRLAWKTRAGAGVLLELADDGGWPPAEQALRRYYSGTNTTAWGAVCVSEKAPERWTVITRDLWKDFGPFTLTGMAPTAMGGEACFDRIELLRSLDGGE